MADVPPTIVEDEDGKWQQMMFTIPLTQLERQIPFSYERLKASGKTTIKIMVTHADQDGHIARDNQVGVQKYAPDLLFTCFPGESRRVNPDFPVVGYHSNITLIWDVKVDGKPSRFIRIEKN